jgi:hypothetical protein
MEGIHEVFQEAVKCVVHPELVVAQDKDCSIM